MFHINQRKKLKFNQIFVFGLSLVILFNPTITWALSSQNFQIPFFDLGPSREISSTSTNFRLESFIGDLVRGLSTSTNFRVDHGFFYPEVVGNVVLNLKALPEMRVPPTGNFDTRLMVEVRNPGSTTPLFSQIVNTDNDGRYFGLLLTGISPGIYDLTAKGYSHLRDKEVNITLVAGTNFVDFSNNETDYLLAGDVNDVPGVLWGDNVVNSIDIAVEVLKLDKTTDIEREDLNQDGIVNSIDLAITIKNLDKWGDP